ncbi:MAG: tetratricopeptide repeat protein [Magnetococcales bacterium]|nr:tetratricopeptide repeat protein [Magnetococcales bacterium]
MSAFLLVLPVPVSAESGSASSDVQAVQEEVTNLEEHAVELERVEQRLSKLQERVEKFDTVLEKVHTNASKIDTMLAYQINNPAVTELTSLFTIFLTILAALVTIAAFFGYRSLTDIVKKSREELAGIDEKVKETFGDLDEKVKETEQKVTDLKNDAEGVINALTEVAKGGNSNIVFPSINEQMTERVDERGLNINNYLDPTRENIDVEDNQQPNMMDNNAQPRELLFELKMLFVQQSEMGRNQFLQQANSLLEALLASQDAESSQLMEASVFASQGVNNRRIAKKLITKAVEKAPQAKLIKYKAIRCDVFGEDADSTEAKEMFRNISHEDILDEETVAAISNYFSRIQDFSTLYEVMSNLENHPTVLDDRDTRAEVYRCMAQAAEVLPNHKQEAKGLYEQSVDLNPKDDQNIARYAQFLNETGEYEEAVEQFKRAIQLDPEDARYYLTLVNTLMETANVNKDEVEKYIELAEKNAKGDPKIYLGVKLLRRRTASFFEGG